MITDLFNAWQDLSVTGQVFSVVAVVQALLVVAVGVCYVMDNPS